ncbi:hypothetical protein ACFWOX_32350 [Streptomyces sp. NPDC058467]|uniref:hypothetical protein n=1 Tax=Streptomyces sp. NPDC058467 TaxID=3346513 RepID=UPI00364BBF6E
MERAAGKVGRHEPPGRAWSAWLCGDHLVSELREVLRQFRQVWVTSSGPPAYICTGSPLTQSFG